MAETAFATPAADQTTVARLTYIVRQDEKPYFLSSALTGGAPEVLVVSPAPVDDMQHPDFAAMFEGGKAKSEALGAALKAAADKVGIASFNAGAAVGNAQGADGLHMSRDQHAKLGKAIAEAVRNL